MRPLFPLVSFLILSVVPACVCSREETTAAVPPDPSVATSAIASTLRRPPLMASLRPAFNGRAPLLMPSGVVRPALRPVATPSAAP
jgi:hypothetical protein